MSGERSAFLSLSAALTGFEPVELEGTGVADLYLDWLRAQSPDGTARLLEAWAAIERDHAPDGREAALRGQVMADPVLGPLARALLALWYTAQWTPLGRGGTPTSFPTAWAEGLVWKAAAAHATGAKPGGFANWAAPPAEAPDGR
ncbi:MAG: hypothetical protein M3320_06045 [Actinomycetota bacterium]|nr:hypothetical protein [Actinomycetota bacterium]MDQ5808220.1 hypothetical protein [Actinomycetota bacterium]